MSRVLGFLAVVVVLVLSVGFAALNGGQRVTLDLGFLTLYQVPLTIAVFGAIVVGMTVMLVAGIHSDLRVRRILRERLAREDAEERARIFVDRDQRDLFESHAGVGEGVEDGGEGTGSRVGTGVGEEPGMGAEPGFDEETGIGEESGIGEGVGPGAVEDGPTADRHAVPPSAPERTPESAGPTDGRERDPASDPAMETDAPRDEDGDGARPRPDGSADDGERPADPEDSREVNLPP